MIHHYDRSQILDDGILDYMGLKFDRNKETDRAEIKEAALRITTLIERFEKHSACPSATKRNPPMGMAAAFLLSVTGKWKEHFQRNHGKNQAAQPYNPKNWSALDRAKNSQSLVEHDLLPPIVIYHGEDDLNCPFSDTKEFKNVLVEKYPTVYREGDTLVLIPFPHKTHGFDYNTKAKDEPLLDQAYNKIIEHWLKDLS